MSLKYEPTQVQTDARKAAFQERFDGWVDDEIPAFHFGSHYSTAGHVLWYLVHLQDSNSFVK